MKFNVHVYYIVRAKLENIEAETMEQATKKAEDLVDAYDLFGCEHPCEHVECTEYAEDIDGYLVDVVGDEDFARSQFFDNQGKAIPPGEPTPERRTPA